MSNTVLNARLREDTMLIDCGTCVARDIACDDCVVTVLLATPPASVEFDAPPARFESDASPPPFEFDEAEWAAVGRLADAGLVPPLRLVRPVGAARPHGRDSTMPETA